MASRLGLVPHGAEVTVTKESSWNCPILQSVIIIIIIIVLYSD